MMAVGAVARTSAAVAPIQRRFGSAERIHKQPLVRHKGWCAAAAQRLQGWTGFATVAPPVMPAPAALQVAHAAQLLQRLRKRRLQMIAC